jgi:hypothetical protein
MTAAFSSLFFQLARFYLLMRKSGRKLFIPRALAGCPVAEKNSGGAVYNSAKVEGPHHQYEQIGPCPIPMK